MNIKHLEYFVAVADELHFGRAAERLGMAQPPLSRQIKLVEEDLGVLLFNRGRSRITLTQAGEVLFERVQDILARLEDARLEARRIGQGAEGRLRIGFVGSSTYGVVPTLIKSFRKHYPNVNLSLTPMNNAGLHRALVRREIDIAIARPGIEDAEVLSRHLATEPLVLAVPDSNPLAAEPLASLASLSAQTLVLYPETPRPSFADQVLDLCRSRDVEINHRVFTMDFQTAIALVSVEVGVAVVPASVGEAQRRGVRFVAIEEREATTSVSINHRIDEQGIHVHRFVSVAVQFSKRPSAAG